MQVDTLREIFKQVFPFKMPDKKEESKKEDKTDEEKKKEEFALVTETLDGLTLDFVLCFWRFTLYDITYPEEECAPNASSCCISEILIYKLI